MCDVCGGAESSLTTDCPGQKVSYDESCAVVSKRIDFINGRWEDL
jgi:hypothetical protein